MRAVRPGAGQRFPGQHPLTAVRLHLARNLRHFSNASSDKLVRDLRGTVYGRIVYQLIGQMNFQWGLGNGRNCYLGDWCNNRNSRQGGGKDWCGDGTLHRAGPQLAASQENEE